MITFIFIWCHLRLKKIRFPYVVYTILVSFRFLPQLNSIFSFIHTYRGINSFFIEYTQYSRIYAEYNWRDDDENGFSIYVRLWGFSLLVSKSFVWGRREWGTFYNDFYHFPIRLRIKALLIEVIEAFAMVWCSIFNANLLLIPSTYTHTLTHPQQLLAHTADKAKKRIVYVASHWIRCNWTARIQSVMDWFLTIILMIYFAWAMRSFFKYLASEEKLWRKAKIDIVASIESLLNTEQ